jgi:antitoxin MazE
MSAQTRLVRWGNSLAVRLPKGVAARARLTEGESLTIEVAAGGRVTIKKSEPELTLEALVSRITPQNRHGEISCGPAVGREVLEEW